MTKFLIPAALALGVFAVSGTTSLVSPVQTAEAAANCNHIVDSVQRTSCETHERRQRGTFPPRQNISAGGDFDMPADPGGGGGGGGDGNR